MRYLLLYKWLLFSLIALCSCAGSGNNTDNVIEVDNIIDIESAVGTGKIWNASGFIENIRYIPLETTKTSIMGKIDKIIVKNNKIYIIDIRHVINIFDMSGRHLNTFNRVGRGPGEYNQMSGFDVGDNGHIYVILPLLGMKIMEYGADLKYIRTIDPGRNNDAFEDILFVKEGLFVSNSIFDRRANLAWIMYDDSVNIHVSYNGSYNYSKMADPLRRQRESKWTVMKRYKQYLFEKDLCIYIRGIDTVFNINYENDYSRSDRYIIKTGKYCFLREMDTKDMTIESTTLNTISLENLIETKTYLFLNFDFRGLAPEPFENDGSRLVFSNYITTVCSIYNKVTGELSVLNQPVPGTLGLKNDIDGGVIFWPETVSDRHELISWCSALDLIQLAEEGKIDRSIANGLKENDNPVIIIATPK